MVNSSLYKIYFFKEALFDILFTKRTENKTMAIEIIQLLVGPMHVFSYILGDDKSKEAIIIDPGAEAQRIYKTAQEKKWNIKKILFTHGHGDHVAAATNLVELCGASCHMCKDDMTLLSSESNLQLISALRGDNPPDIHSFLAHEDNISLGDFTIKVLHAPGHSPGSICFIYGNNIFTGDVLFEGGIGRTDLPCSNPKLMNKSLEKIMALPGDTIVYPGHAYGPRKSTTIGRERMTNPYLSSLC